MRISDWSSDVCSSDLELVHLGHRLDEILPAIRPVAVVEEAVLGAFIELQLAAAAGTLHLLLEVLCRRDRDQPVLRPQEDNRRWDSRADVVQGRDRSEESREGKAWVSTGRSRGA